MTVNYQLQTRHGLEGNCLQACIVSLYGGDIDSVPDFEAESGGPWLQELSDWLYCQYDKFVVSTRLLDLEDAKTMFHDALVITSIISDHPDPGVERHVVISRRGLICFDPGIGEVCTELTQDMDPVFFVVGDVLR